MHTKVRLQVITCTSLCEVNRFTILKSIISILQAVQLVNLETY